MKSTMLLVAAFLASGQAFSQSSSFDSTSEVACISYLAAFESALEPKEPEVSSDLARALIGRLQLRSVLATGKDLPTGGTKKFSAEGYQACIASGVKRPELIMLINALNSENHAHAIEQYVECGEGVFLTASLVEPDFGKMLSDRVSYELGKADASLRRLYPHFAEQVDYIIPVISMQRANMSLAWDPEDLGDGVKHLIIKSQIGKSSTICTKLGFSLELFTGPLNDLN